MQEMSEEEALRVTKRISVISFPQDEEVVRSLSPTQRAEMAMTGQVSENLHTNLEHSFWLARWRAVQVLREVSPKNDERAVSLLIERTRDVMLEVVVGALDSLQEICERGHRVCRVVVDNVLPLLEHEGSVVRHAAVKCLEKTSALWDEDVCKGLLKRFSDPDSSTHLAAMSAILVLGDRNDYRIVRAGVDALRAKEESKREAAVALLKRFSTRGDQSVVKELESVCLNDESEALRAMAASALSNWASKPDDSSTCSLLVRLTTQSRDNEVRRTTLLGMLTRLRSGDPAVRQTALKSLTNPEGGPKLSQLSPTKRA